ncbi:MAG: hypothetical protein ACFFDI_26310, partial [Promethearchaeota archaeon]
QLGIYFNQLHSSYQATIGYPLMVFSGLLGSAVLISLFFPRLSFKKLFKALNASQLKGENL